MVRFAKAEPYVVMFEVTVRDKVQRQMMEAPRIVLEQEFTRLVEQAANSPAPVKVKMSRKVPIYDPFNKRMIERENSLVFTNKAWNERN